MLEAIRETIWKNMKGAALAPHGLNVSDLHSTTRPVEQQRNLSREGDEESTIINYRENDN